MEQTIYRVTYSVGLHAPDVGTHLRLRARGLPPLGPDPEKPNLFQQMRLENGGVFEQRAVRNVDLRDGSETVRISEDLVSELDFEGFDQLERITNASPAPKTSREIYAQIPRGFYKKFDIEIEFDDNPATSGFAVVLEQFVGDQRVDRQIIIFDLRSQCEL